jgi:hypothetical protein
MVDYVADDDASGGVSFEEFTDFSRGHLLLIYPGFWAQVGRLNTIDTVRCSVRLTPPSLLPAEQAQRWIVWTEVLVQKDRSEE